EASLRRRQAATAPRIQAKLTLRPGRRRAPRRRRATNEADGARLISTALATKCTCACPGAEMTIHPVRGRRVSSEARPSKRADARCPAMQTGDRKPENARQNAVEARDVGGRRTSALRDLA